MRPRACLVGAVRNRCRSRTTGRAAPKRRRAEGRARASHSPRARQRRSEGRSVARWRVTDPHSRCRSLREARSGRPQAGFASCARARDGRAQMRSLETGRGRRRVSASRCACAWAVRAQLRPRTRARRPCVRSGARRRATRPLRALCPRPQTHRAAAGPRTRRRWSLNQGGPAKRGLGGVARKTPAGTRSCRAGSATAELSAHGRAARRARATRATGLRGEQVRE
jgi:hypothetical protein